jgi:pimeloyl-ACP methyl ester carboxylesterase
MEEPNAGKMDVRGCNIALRRAGVGCPLLILHGASDGGEWLPFMADLATHHDVIAPEHPGFGASDTPAWLDTIPDLASFYLDLLDQLDLANVHLVGADLGGWIAAEMMVRSSARFSRLVLTAPLGIKLRGRDERDIADIHAMTPAEYLRLAWADARNGDVDYTALPDSELAAIVRGREAFALYGWKPYMHNPRLKRWLHRIDRPTLLLWGAADGIVTPFYGEGWRQEIAGARIDVIPDAGHFPHWEQPEEFVQRLSAFVDGRND